MFVIDFVLPKLKIVIEYVTKHHNNAGPKGQLISECLFDNLKFTKKLA